MKSRLISLVPLVFLSVDIFTGPFLYDTRTDGRPLNVHDLFDADPIHIGRVRGHELWVSFDDIGGDDFLSHAADGRNGLVISHYVARQGSTVATRTGQLGRAIEERLSGASLPEGRRFTALLRDSDDGAVGSVIPFRITEPLPGLPLEAIYVILFSDSHGNAEKARIIESAVGNALKAARADGLDRLFVPCLTIDPRDPDALPFSDFFRAVFDAAPGRRRPDLYLSLFPGWPSEVLEMSVSGLDQAVRVKLAGADHGERLYHPAYRTLMVGLFVSLFVSSFFVRLTLKRLWLITLLFLGLAGAAQSAAHAFLAEHNPDVNLAIKTIGVLVYAAFLPWIVKIDPKGVFSKKGEGNES